MRRKRRKVKKEQREWQGKTNKFTCIIASILWAATVSFSPSLSLLLTFLCFFFLCFLCFLCFFLCWEERDIKGKANKKIKLWITEGFFFFLAFFCQKIPTIPHLSFLYSLKILNNTILIYWYKLNYLVLLVLLFFPLFILRARRRRRRIAI